MAGKDAEQFIPSRTLSIVSAFSKGFGDYQKRLEEMESQKAQQRSELLKVIMPQYMRQQHDIAQYQRELPFKERGMDVAEGDLARKIEHDLATLEEARLTRQSGETIALAQKDLTLGLAKLSGELKIEMEDFRLKHEKLQNLYKKGEAQLDRMSREKISGEEITGRADVADTAAAAAMKRLEETQTGKMDFLEREYELKSDFEDKHKQPAVKKLDPVLKSKLDAMAEMQGTTAKWLGVISEMEDDEAKDTMVELYKAFTSLADMHLDDINVEVKALGGRPFVTTGMVEFEEVEEKSKMFGIIPRTKTKQVPVMPSLPGIIPAKSEASGTQPANLPSLKTTGTQFNNFVDMMVKQEAITIPDIHKAKLKEMGIDPDAVEKEARKRQGR